MSCFLPPPATKPTRPCGSFNGEKRQNDMTEPIAVPLEARQEDYRVNVVDVADFNERVVGAYNNGTAERGLEADDQVARSIVPAGTGALRDFSYIAPDIPEFITENCVGCMECVTECPDTAILGKVVDPSTLEEYLGGITDEELRKKMTEQWGITNKYYTVLEKKGVGGGKFGIFIDPTKCKGCAECVTICDDNALKMIAKTDDVMLNSRKSHRYFKNIGPSATGFLYGRENIGIVAATGCNTVYTSTYPYNPYLVPWTNSLFENAPADAMGVRARWDQLGW
ncbi:MAG: 4Fe-4S binding protein, partial [Acidobacteria bacterium]|nr:4Fe-4S binding protein [Acidobacteriota bacterium]